MVEVAAGAAVVMDVVRPVDVAAGIFSGIDAVESLSAGTGGISVMVNLAIEDLVVAGPDGDATFGSVLNFEAVDDVVAAVDVDPDVAIGKILSINDSAAGNFGLEGDRAG